MAKNPMAYISLKKIIKRHFVKQKKISFHFKKKESCIVKFPNRFQGYYVNIYKTSYDGKIVINVTKPRDEYHDISLFKEEITNLDRLFYLLANGCKELELLIGAREI